MTGTEAMAGGLPVILAIVAPLIGGLFVLGLAKSPNLRETASLLTAGSLFAVVLTLLQPVMAGERPSTTAVAP